MRDIQREREREREREIFCTLRNVKERIVQIIKKRKRIAREN